MLSGNICAYRVYIAEDIAIIVLIRYCIAMSTVNKTRIRSEAALFELGVDQDGYFSVDQALAAGVSRAALARAAARGDVMRTERGVYRLARFPDSARSTYWEVLLWAQSDRGNIPAAISHRSALALHNLSDVNPSRVDIMLPAGIRIRGQVPDSVRLHRRSLEKDDVTTVDGLTVTTPYRTVLDCLIDDIGHDVVRQAMNGALGRGLLSQAEFDLLIPLYDLHPKILDFVVRERARAKQA